jgi:hypothetical protein
VDVLVDILTRYAQGLKLAWVWGLPGIVLALAWVGSQGALAAKLEAVPTLAVRARLGVQAVATVLAVYWAWQLRWLCDDAFISFRYAENLARGLGFVWNREDRVEGYTNFLWTLILAGAKWVGLDIGQSSVVLSLASFAALIALSLLLARRLFGMSLVVSLASLCVAAHYTTASFGTSGLETMFAAMLLLLALERATAGAYVTAGLAGIAAAMAHPDHGVFYASLGVSLLLGRDTRKGLVRYALPFVLLYVPYFYWRYTYYGDLFPNTYYAKSANLAYFDQGFVYAATIFIGGGFFLSLPLALYGLWTQRATAFGRFCMIGMPLFSVYVAKIGGDFMYGRLFTPLIAPYLLLCEAGVRALLTHNRRVLALGALLGLVACTVPAEIFKPYEKRWMVADERTFYRLKSFSPIVVDSMYFEWSKTLTKFFPAHRDTPRLAMQCVGMIGYYTGLPLVDGFGLTDRFVAHTEIHKRGRPGHEKHASPAYIASRDVDVSDVAVYPPPYKEHTRLKLDRTQFYLGRYAPGSLGKKPKKGMTFTKFEKHIKTFMTRPITPLRSEDTACDAWFVQEYYYSRVKKPDEVAVFQRRVLDAGRPVGQKSTDAALYEFRSTHRPDPATAFHFEPAELARFEPDLSLRSGFGLPREPAPQDTVTGYEGAFLNTFLRNVGDAGRGRLRSKPFALVGDVMQLRVGGGRHRSNLRVSLLVDGERKLSSGGCDTEMMGERLWQIGAFKGKLGVLEIVDDVAGPWAHLVVDEVVQWVPKAK